MAGYFSIFLTLATLVSGFIYFADKYWWSVKRKDALLTSVGGNTELNDEQLEQVNTANSTVEFFKEIFPVVALVFVLRSFLYEPFQIPSGSMMPTLLVGDFILVEKYSYGLKNPVTSKNMLEFEGPQRGDIAVFKYPENPTIDYIKRVVGLPGDRVIYRNKELYVLPKCAAGETCSTNYQLAKQTSVNSDLQFSIGPYKLNEFNIDLLGAKQHNILINPIAPEQLRAYFRQANTQNDEWVVPDGHYFVMGDNRDNSLDSRFWGFVPREHVVGQAVAIWMSFEFDRDENSFLPGFIPTGIRFERIGGLN